MGAQRPSRRVRSGLARRLHAGYDIAADSDRSRSAENYRKLPVRATNMYAKDASGQAEIFYAAVALDK